MSLKTIHTNRLVDWDKIVNLPTDTVSELNNKVDKVSWKWLSTNDFDDAYKTKLDWIENWAEVNNIHNLNDIEDINIVDVQNDNIIKYNSNSSKWENANLPWWWDMLKSTYDTDNDWIVDDSDKLNNQEWSYYLDRANHTWTQTASTISDFDTEVSNNTDVSDNTSARHTHSNKTVLDNITDWWAWDKYLSDDWSYKTLTNNSDEYVKISDNDTTAWYLNWKLVAWTNISLTENNDWWDETLAVDCTIDISWKADKVSWATDWNFAWLDSNWNLTDSWNKAGDFALKSDMIDEDDMASDSDTKYPTQQSVKAYVDANGWWWWTWLTLYDWAIAWEQTTWTVFEVPMAWDATLSKFKISLKTLPEWADFIAKIYKNWTEDASATIATDATVTNWLYIADDTSFESWDYTENDAIKVEISQVWSDVAWSDFVWQIS